MAEKIEDFGKKIGGAKKERWAGRGLSIDDLVEMNEAERSNYIKKKYILPKIDYQQLVDNGMSRNVAYFYKLVIDSLPTEPKYDSYYSRNKSDDEKKEYINTTRNNFINYLKDVKNLLETNVKKDEDIEKFYKEFYKPKFCAAESGWYFYAKEGYEELISSKTLKALQTKLSSIKREVQNKQFCMTNEEYLDSKISILKFDGNRIKWDDYYKALKVSTEYGSIYYYDHLNGSNGFKENTYFIVNNRTIVASNIDTEEEANTIKQALIEKTANILKDNKKEDKNKKKKFIPLQLEHIKRIADFEWRKNTSSGLENASTDDFLNDFKFSGGEFGNWESQLDRQTNLNMAYDAFKDMAYALDINDKDITGNGVLSIAFGSRGSGDALAHYEPMRNVINLTKMRGAGSLAHEMGHFFDNLIAITTDNAIDTFASDSIYKYPLLKDLVTTMQYKTVKVSVEEIEEAKNKEADRFSKNIDNAVSWSFNKNKMTQEQLDKLETIVSNCKKEARKDANPFTTFWVSSSWSGNVEEPKSLVQLNDFHKSLYGRVISKDYRRDLACKLSSYGGVYNREWPTEKKIETNFYKDSKEFDKRYSKSSKGYWASSIEMLARSFENYIKDKLKEKGVRNDYLCGHAESCKTWISEKVKENGVMVDKERIIYAYPIGEERKIINQKWDELIETLKSEKKLFSNRDVPKPISKAEETQKEIKEKLALAKEKYNIDISMTNDSLKEAGFKPDENGKYNIFDLLEYVNKELSSIEIKNNVKQEPIDLEDLKRKNEGWDLFSAQE